MKKAVVSSDWRRILLWTACLMTWAVALFSTPDTGHADDSLCAVVKIEIRQELTLERQAFDAHMTINNGLTHISLEDVGVSVWFTDEEGNAVLATSDPDDPAASFFIRVDSMANISDVDGAGSVAPSTSADIHWLIIPAPGASNGLESGTLYNVGATLSYTLGGEANTTEVTPDYIYVKPMPEIALDYFLPSEVYGDDAFTTAIEPPVPFSLGVRVKNSGDGTARDLKIESAQPRIVENEQGLLIGFALEGSQVNGQPATDSLLVDFGDIAPGTSGTARWTMSCTLSGKFTEFDADFSHSDELGGEVTSLIDAVRTHFLVRDVLVDLVGRDQVRDFLARDDDILRVYESESVDTVATDLSALSGIYYLGTRNGRPAYRFSMPVNDGFVYARLPDPYSGGKVIYSAMRNDGKTIKSDNIWLSKSRDDQSWDYFIDLFDVNTTGEYTVVFDDAAAVPQAPVLQYIADVVVVEGNRVSFVAMASDPDGTIPALSAAVLPVGATFTDQGDGSGVFDWTPVVGQAGAYTITFKASDGELDDNRRVLFTIRSIDDTDGDGMNDAWEMAHFGTLDRDGSGDFDGDGICDLDEYLAGSDPTAEDHAPTVPTILSPLPDESISTPTPALEIENSTDADGDEITYRFELYTDEQFSEPVNVVDDVVQGTNTTSWTLGEALTENRHYFWRVRATDGYSYSQWAYGSFFVNTANDSPQEPAVSYPPDGAEVDSLTPYLEVTGISDPDEEQLTCSFEVYADMGMTVPVADVDGLVVPDDGVVDWTVDSSLSDNTSYFWRAVVTDGQGMVAQTPLASFTVNTANHAPSAPAISFPADGEEVSAQSVDLSVVNAEDADGDTVEYHFEIDTDPGFTGAEKQVSGRIDEGTDTTAWPVSGLSENTIYYWRARATDSAASSQWVAARFFVNGVNDAPDVPNLKNPGEDAWVGVPAPTLILADGIDADGDSLAYLFEVYTEPALENLLARGESLSAAWTVVTELTDKTRYYWRARVIDAHGGEGDWMPAASFFVREEEQQPPDAITVKFSTDEGSLLESIRVYAFTEAGAYTGVNAITDAEGTAVFAIDAFDPAAYRFRADYLGDQFWSETVSIPETTTIDLPIAVETVSVTVAAAAGTVSGVPVYVFSDTGAYLGVYRETDANGQVSFELPEGEAYQFRADLMTSQYWSGAITVDAAGNAVTVDAGGGWLQVAVRQDESTPMAGVKVYLFNAAGSYIGVSATTDESGLAGFDVTEGDYLIRADYLGYRYWSDAITVVTDTAATIEIAHQVSQVTVQERFAGDDTPLQGASVYLFTDANAYMGQVRTTDQNGQVSFDLPQNAYKIRADYLNGQYWSETFTWDDATVTIPTAEARVTVTGAGLPRQGVKVYVFSTAGSYLNINATTDSAGQVTFRLPEGRYDFRADDQGSQFWAREQALAADEVTPVNLSLGGGTFELILETSESEPLAGIACYVFDENDAYLGLTGATDETGSASFDLVDGSYRFRVDYYGHRFWSDTVAVPGSLSYSMVIPETQVRVNGISARQPVPDVRVYLFSTEGAYLGIYETTDDAGAVQFELPAGIDFRFRADVLGNPYWSGDVTVADGIDPVVIDAGGGILQTTVQTDTGSPLAGLKAYLFNADGKYLGLSAETDASGQVAFAVPEGVYQVRADTLGYSFWSDAINVAADTSATLVVPRAAVTVSVTESYQTIETVLAGVPVYLFSPTGSYLGINGTTDENGQVVFDLPLQPYMVRVDHIGEQYWSDPFTGSNPTVRIPMADAAVTVTGAGLPAAGVNVYLFSTEGAYLGSVQSTEADGMAVFRLPASSFRFRADYQGNQYWSADIALEADVENAVLVSVGGGSVTLSLEAASGVPMSGVNCHVFSDSGSYLGLKGSTDENGRAAFDLADGTFRFRADYLGYQYWSDALVVPDSLSATMTIAHTDATLTFQADYMGTIEPFDGRRAYLFTPAGSYLGQYRETDAAGQAVFRLPDQAYTLRCDELGQHYWSESFQSTDPTVTVARGKAVIRVTFDGESVENARVYLFSSTDSYLGRYENTDSGGAAEFLLPAGQYRFRVDLDGRQQWTPVTAVDADLETVIDVAMQ